VFTTKDLLLLPVDAPRFVARVPPLPDLIGQPGGLAATFVLIKSFTHTAFLRLIHSRAGASGQPLACIRSSSQFGHILDNMSQPLLEYLVENEPAFRKYVYLPHIRSHLVNIKLTSP
jgi:hypothetical protein